MNKLTSFLLSMIFLFSATGQNFETNKLYVKFKNEANINISFDNKLELNKEKVFFKYLVNQFSINSIQKAFKTQSDDLDNTFLIKFSNEDEINDIIALFQKQSFVSYAEKIPIYELFYTPNDPQFPQQWNLNTIQAEQAWNISTGNQNVVIAVTDDAVLTTHEDLSTNIFVNTNEIPGNGIDDDNNGYIDDINGWDAANNDNNPNPINLNNDHGVHVSGIVAASTDNNTGIASIGFNVKILAVKIGNSPSGSLTGAFSGLDYAISCGYTNVINMSWGGSAYSNTMQNLLNAGYNANIVLIAAAGNSNTSAPMYPASYNNVISVGATNITDQRAVFSNYGTNIDVMAPGVGILSCENNSTNNAYGIKSGTSMAAPLVAGLAGLILSNTPNLTPAQVENCLKSTCDNIDASNPSFIGQIGAGRINAFQALQCFNTPPIAQFNANITNACTNQVIQFTDNSTGTTLTNWLWDFGDGNTSTIQNPTHTYLANGTYTVTLNVTNAFGTDTEIKTNYIVINSPTATLSGSSTIPAGGNAFLQVQFTGSAPYNFVYSDGLSNFPINGITNNPYYFSVSPNINTTYSLVSYSSNSCTGSISGNATITIGSNSTPSQDTSCNLGQYVINDNGNTELQSITHASNGDYVIAGKTSSAGAGQEDVFVTRFDNQNNIIWSKTYGTSSEEIGHPINIKATPNGFLISTSSLAYASGTRVLVLINIDNNGNILWQKRMGNVSGYSNSRTINIDNQGNYLIAGSKTFNTQGLDDVYIIKLDNLGNIIWTYSYGTNMHDHSFSIIQTNDNGYISVGSSTFSGTGQTSKLLIKVDQNGIFQWSKFYDRINYDNIYDIDIANNGLLYTIGIEGDLNNFDCSLTKISSSGNIVWSKTLGGLGNDNPGAIKIDSQGNIYISGYSNSFGNGLNEIFLSKLDDNGNELWTKYYGGIQNENHYGTARNLSVDETHNKIYIFGNSTSFGSNASDPYIIVTDLDGNSDCNSTDVNWTVNITNPTSGNAPGVSGTAGTLVNANFVSANFNYNLDTICNTVCQTNNSNSSCTNGQYFIDDNGSSQLQNILQTPDGGFITAGQTNLSGAGLEDILVTKFDSQNNHQKMLVDFLLCCSYRYKNNKC
ncbi:MAG: S8 family serine peptidase [Chitinophagales bacterium]